MLQRVTANHAGLSSAANDLITVGASRKSSAGHTHPFLLLPHIGFTLFGRLAIVLFHSEKCVHKPVHLRVERQIEDSHAYVSIAGMEMPDLAIRPSSPIGNQQRSLAWPRSVAMATVISSDFLPCLLTVLLWEW